MLQALVLGAMCFSRGHSVIMYQWEAGKAERIVSKAMLDQLDVWRLPEASTHKQCGGYFWNVPRVPFGPNSAPSLAFTPTSC